MTFHFLHPPIPKPKQFKNPNNYIPNYNSYCPIKPNESPWKQINAGERMFEIWFGRVNQN